MVRVFSIAILRNDVTPAVALASSQDLSSFGFFQRSAVGEFMTFFSKTVAERTQAGQRQDVEENSTFPPTDRQARSTTQEMLIGHDRLCRSCVRANRGVVWSRYIR
jgi:hypothetical protein